MNTEFDLEKLNVEFGELGDEGFDFSWMGFEDNNFLPAGIDEQGKLDELDPKWVICPQCGNKFDSRGNEE